MAERLGGTGGRREPSGGAALQGTGALGGTARGFASGTAAVSPAKERHPSGTGGRPLSAPPVRRPDNAPKSSAFPGAVNSGGVQRPLTEVQRQSARTRVEETRLVKEAQFWGRLTPPKRDLPAYWSVSAHGQPFNDERLASGTAHIFQILDPPKLNKQEPPAAGPATLQAAGLRKSLEVGKRLYNKADLTPLTSTRGMQLDRLTEEDREFLMMKLPPQARMHALRNCHDRDTQTQNFLPWTQAVLTELNAAAWHRNKEQCIRLAVQKLENMMRTHLEFLSEMECRRARAPAALTKDVLKRAFWKVDPYKTGSVSLQQFLQVWQNVLQLWEYQEAQITDATGKSKMVFQPLKPFLLDRNAAAAIFVKYGFDRDGLLPYVVFIQALCAAPSRLLGQEIILDNVERGKNGLCDEVDVAMCVGDAKILYPKCKNGVFPPSGFDPLIAFRSMMLPKAHLQLEHVYGYAGISNLSNNVFYTHNTSELESEVVYYTGAVGIVFSKARFDEGLPSQRFFFGHDNDIECLAVHPNRRFVATGQQLAPGSVPYLCIWDVDTCEQLQRLDHCQDDRSIIACCFSGMRDSQDPRRLGGGVVCTVTSDDRHTIHLWAWMTNSDAFCKAMYIPGWCYGPDKKLPDLQAAGLFFKRAKQQKEAWEAEAEPKSDAKHARRQRLVEQYLNSDHPLITSITNTSVKPEHAEGFLTSLPPTKNDGTWQLLAELPGYNGTPPTVYGIVWNPFRPHTGDQGSEFCTYGVKHLKTWTASLSESGELSWISASAAFGPTNVQNVLSACYVPAKHDLAAPGDSCLLTGFASGEVGLWVPPYPTRPGSVYTLTRLFTAHDPGPQMTLNDGTQVYGGVRVITLRSDLTTVLTAGSDGYVVTWQLEVPQGNNASGVPKKGVALRCKAQAGEEYGPYRFKLAMPTGPLEKEKLPMLRALDTHTAKPVEFIAGTDGCDIWEVDKDPRVLIEGHEDDLFCCATHPAPGSTLFATACSSNRLRVWDSLKRDVVKSASMGFACAAVAYSQEELPQSCVPGWEPPKGRGYHLAVSSKSGRVAVLDADTLQPLVQLRDAKEGITEMKYSPAGGPKMLAAACNDLKIYLYKVTRGYQLVGRCVGHSGSVLHLDWTLPVSAPLQLRGQMLLLSSDTSREILCWNPATAKKVTSNQRDAQRYTWTSPLGFNTMGIWPDCSDGTDVNSVDRAAIGAAYTDGAAGPTQLATAAESADKVPGAGYLVTADDFSFVKLFNYPTVWDDAPYKRFRGHSSHVTCVRFSADCRQVVSVGGHDRGIYQWRTYGINAEDMDDDRAVLKAVQKAIENKREDSLTLIPKPLAKWGTLDATGKNFGPVADAEKLSTLKSTAFNQTGRSMGASMNSPGESPRKSVTPRGSYLG